MPRPAVTHLSRWRSPIRRWTNASTMQRNPSVNAMITGIGETTQYALVNVETTFGTTLVNTRITVLGTIALSTNTRQPVGRSCGKRDANIISPIGAHVANTLLSRSSCTANTRIGSHSYHSDEPLTLPRAYR